MIHFSLKLECEKLASEKMEIQRHYVMVIIEIASMHEQLSSWCIKVDLFAAINDRLAAAQPASHSLGMAGMLNFFSLLFTCFLHVLIIFLHVASIIFLLL